VENHVAVRICNVDSHLILRQDVCAYRVSTGLYLEAGGAEADDVLGNGAIECRRGHVDGNSVLLENVAVNLVVDSVSALKNDAIALHQRHYVIVDLAAAGITNENGRIPGGHHDSSNDGPRCPSQQCYSDAGAAATEDGRVFFTYNRQRLVDDERLAVEAWRDYDRCSSRSRVNRGLNARIVAALVNGSA
jgi:hypothetical protein